MPKINIIPLEIRNKIKRYPITTSIYYHIGDPGIKSGKGDKMHKVWKGRRKRHFYSQMMHLCMQKIQQNLETNHKNQDREVNFKKSLNTKINFISGFKLKVLENKVKMPFITYLGMNLMKVCKFPRIKTTTRIIKRIRENLPK